MSAMQIFEQNRSLITTPAEALCRIEAGLTSENDCSMFVLTISGGPDPVSVGVRPDEVREILGQLRRGESP